MYHLRAFYCLRWGKYREFRMALSEAGRGTYIPRQASLAFAIGE